MVSDSSSGCAWTASRRRVTATSVRRVRHRRQGRPSDPWPAGRRPRAWSDAAEARSRAPCEAWHPWRAGGLPPRSGRRRHRRWRPGRRRRRRRRGSRRARARAPLLVRVGHRDGRDQPLGVRPAAGRSGSARGCPVSTRWPWCMTAIRSASISTTARSWVMNRQAKPVSRCSSWNSSSTRGLHRDVERGRRLVGDQQLRLQRERAGDADALPLAAGELVRVAVAHRSRQLDLVEQRLDPLAAGRRPSRPSAQQQRLADRLADRQARVQRRARVLEDDADACAQLAELLACRADHVRADDAQRALRRSAAGRPSARPMRGLARAGLADQADDLAAADLEVDLVDRPERRDRRRASGTRSRRPRSTIGRRPSGLPRSASSAASSATLGRPRRAERSPADARRRVRSESRRCGRSRSSLAPPRRGAARRRAARSCTDASGR